MESMFYFNAEIKHTYVVLYPLAFDLCLSRRKSRADDTNELSDFSSL